MRTMNLQEAAAFLHMHPYTVMQKVNAGEIPGAKPGKRWVFIEEDLAHYLRGKYRFVENVSIAQQHPNVSHAKRQEPDGLDRDYTRLLGLVDCPQIHSPKPSARSGASHAHAARSVACEAVELVGNSAMVAQSPMRMARSDRR